MESQSLNPKSGHIFAIVVYDISSTKIRNSLIKILKSYGFRVQKSVFEALTTPDKLEEMCKKISRFFKKDNDDTVRVYSISYGGKLWSFGKDEQKILIDSSDEPIVI